MREGLFRRDDRAWSRAGSIGMWTLTPWAGQKPLSLERMLGRRLQSWPLSEHERELQREREAEMVMARLQEWLRD